MTTFADKMAAAASDIGNILHDAKNAFHKYDYTSSEAVKGRVQRALSAHGLYVSEAKVSTVGEMTGKAAVAHYSVRVSDGQSSAGAEAFGAGVDATDKAPMKACTAAFKYALVALFCIPMGEDPEADSQPDREAAKPKAQAAKPKTSKPSEPNIPALSKLGGPATLKAWCQENAEALRKVAGKDEKKFCWEAIQQAAHSLDVDETQVRDWLGMRAAERKAAQ